tara:strand:+ start:103 stop:423 length:321 start_codon:yes stop_codon:yes gene_type:complete
MLKKPIISVLIVSSVLVVIVSSFVDCSIIYCLIITSETTGHFLIALEGLGALAFLVLYGLLAFNFAIISTRSFLIIYILISFNYLISYDSLAVVSLWSLFISFTLF